MDLVCGRSPELIQQLRDGKLDFTISTCLPARLSRKRTLSSIRYRKRSMMNAKAFVAI